MAHCWLLKNATLGPTKPALMTVRTQSPILTDRPEVTSSLHTAEDECTPFISKGTIHALGSNDVIPITIL